MGIWKTNFASTLAASFHVTIEMFCFCPRKDVEIFLMQKDDPDDRWLDLSSITIPYFYHNVSLFP